MVVRNFISWLSYGREVMCVDIAILTMANLQQQLSRFNECLVYVAIIGQCPMLEGWLHIGWIWWEITCLHFSYHISSIVCIETLSMFVSSNKVVNLMFFSHLYKRSQTCYTGVDPNLIWNTLPNGHLGPASSN